MAPKTKKTKEIAKPPETGDSADRMARIALNPAYLAVLAIEKFGGFSGKWSSKMVAELERQVKAAQDGDLRRSEAMLVSQAHCLDAIFGRLVLKAAANSQTNLSAAETCMRLALKAQSQCRATIEALAEIKNPKPLAFVHQANIAQGPQQVNNGVDPSRAREKENQQNKLLEFKDGERVDTRAESTTARSDSVLETVGTVNRPKNRRGKS